MTYVPLSRGQNIYRIPEKAKLDIPGVVEPPGMNYSLKPGILQPPRMKSFYSKGGMGKKIEEPRYDVQENSHLSYSLPTDRYHFNFRIYI